jgi:hypothetical protein
MLATHIIFVCLLKLFPFQIGEHLLSLVNEIETFAMSEAISDLQPLIGSTEDLHLSQKGWKQLDSIFEIKEVA